PSAVALPLSSRGFEFRLLHDLQRVNRAFMCADYIRPMRHAQLIVLALALAVPAGAQQPPLSLHQALELARVHSPLLSVAGTRVLVAEGLARERAAPPNPIVELRQENVGGSITADRFATITLPLDLNFQRTALRAARRQSVAP